MALKIRLQRHGQKKRPFYAIVVTENTAPRDGKFIEKLGRYNPLLNDDNKERIILDSERITYWLSKGAEPTERVLIFLRQAGIAQDINLVKKLNKKLDAKVTLIKERVAKKKAEEKIAEEKEKAEALKAQQQVAEANKEEEQKAAGS